MATKRKHLSPSDEPIALDCLDHESRKAWNYWIQKKLHFLIQFEALHRINAAAKAVGVATRLVDYWVTTDGEFATRFRASAVKVQAATQAHRQQRLDEFLETYTEIGTIANASRLTGVNPRTIYEAIDRDPDFAKRFKDAREAATDALEMECRKRATDGETEPVYYQGAIVGYNKRKSDTCLLALLNAYRSDLFRQRHEHTGKDGGPMGVVFVSYDHNMKPDDMPDAVPVQAEPKALPPADLPPPDDL